MIATLQEIVIASSSGFNEASSEIVFAFLIVSQDVTDASAITPNIRSKPSIFRSPFAYY